MEKFQLGKSRFNLSTYLGRFYHNLDIIDPRTFFVSEVINNNIKRIKF